MNISQKYFQKTLSGNQILLTIYAAIVCFCTYSCMYAFRKPFTAATYEGLTVGAIHFKIILVLSQLVGYTLSKFWGIKFISEMQRTSRAITILVLIGFAALSLLLFALTPYPYSAVFMFMNGLPLGMIWGLVFSYIEGRRSTEMIGAVLCVSFIFSSGFVKRIGKSLMVDYHVPEQWMPFATGMLFLVPMILLIFLLEQIPPPSAADIENRVERKPMTAEDRSALLKTFLPGIIALVLTYGMLSIMRDLRDNFIAEIWKEAGLGNVASVFTDTENIISLVVLASIGLMIVIKDNLMALLINHGMVALGLALAGGASFLFAQGSVSAFNWMLFAGLGLYLAYVPFNCIFFERLIAAFRYTANVGFLMYLSDSFGYLGSLGVLLYKEFGTHDLQWSSFMSTLIMGVSVIGLVSITFSFIYFQRKHRSYHV